jgi:Putative peptidoglycan binding domain
MTTKKYATFAFMLITAGAFAQAGGQEGPPNAEVGKCYAKCYVDNQYKESTEQMLIAPAHKKLKVVPAVYETATERILVKEAGKRLEVIPAVYETTTDRILVKEAGKRLEVVPGAYETTTERILVKEGGKKLVTIPAKFESKTERVMTAAAGKEWVKKRDSHCLSQNPDDCIILCLEEIPAQYRTVTSSVVATEARVEEVEVAAEYITVTKQMLKTPPSTREVEVPAEYQTITKRMLKTPATTREMEVPAEYKTITKQVLKSPATTTEVEVAAEYTTVSKKELVKEGEYTEWREILCDNKVTNYTIRQIQEALIAKGYNVGDAGADNVMGSATRNALIEYQRANKLPVGNLNMETLKSLGINY